MQPDNYDTYDDPEDDPYWPLLKAAERDDVPALRSLLAEGMPVDPRPLQESALMRALRNGRLRAAQVLIEAGANVNHLDGRTPLVSACEGRDLAAIELVLTAGANLNSASGNLLGWIVRPDDERLRPVLALLVKKGLDPNTEDDAHTVSILMAVCKCGDLETARLLLDRGADPNKRLHGTALTVAEENGHHVLVDLLLERGAKPERPAVLPDAASEARLRAALDQPADGRRRLAWAEVLISEGLRAAAACEVEAATTLGADVPEALRAALTLENPPGTRWHFAPFDPPRTGVTPRIEDSRFPGARVTTGTQTLPLAVVLGPACTRCDEKSEVVCDECGGTGVGNDYMTGRDFACEPRQTCGHCRGLKFEVLRWGHFGEGRCRHEVAVAEMTMGKLTLSRCAACGLPALWVPHPHVAIPQRSDFACGVCGFFGCRCVRSSGS